MRRCDGIFKRRVQISTRAQNIITTKIADSSVDSVKTRREKILAYTEVREFSLFRSFGARCAARCDFYMSAMTDIETITSGSATIPLGPKPRLIWSTYSIPEVTCPQMVY